MKTSSYSVGKVVKNFEKFFDKRVINRLGKVSGFIKRKPQKITAFAFVAGFIESCSKGVNTYSSWAANTGNLTGEPVTKQALSDRMNEGASTFALQLFSKAMSAKLASVNDSKLFKTFKRVLLQDSTTLALPQYLSEHYPGNTSRGEKKAIARLQCIIDIVKMKWLHISVDAFTDNDQSASHVALPVLKKGDLLLRDLGYFVLDILQQVIDKKAFFISRLRYGVTLYDEKGKEINWKDLCRRKGTVDRQVWVGKKHKLRVRIIMVPLPAAQVAEKIRKARNDRDKRLNHSSDYYLWLRYNVFISNVETDTLSAEQIVQAYKVRWQIEILFKSWKSGFRLQQILHHGCTNIHRVNTTIYLLLMFICLVMQKVYIKFCKSIKKKYGRELSLIRLSSFVCKNITAVICLPPSKLKQQLATHCCYEKRNDRTNMTQLIINF